MVTLGLTSHLLLRESYILKIDLSERAGLLAAVLQGAGVALVFAVIWVPWFAYNYVPDARLEPSTFEKARNVPNDALLEELAGYHLGQRFPWAEDRQLIDAAEKLLRGRVELPGFAAGTFAPPFSAASMAAGPTMWQLFVHSFGLPQVMLDAYKVTGRAEFLRGTADYLVAYDAYEGSGWRPSGYLWGDMSRLFVRNDHAVSARVAVLAGFWRLYRHSPEYRPDVAMAVFRMAARCSYLLADPSRFTFATNHGVMQNLAACQLSLSFPTLPGVEGYCRLAFKRLDEQLAFFINDEGFVLEHSPGYQQFALRLIGIAFRYRTLLDLQIPDHWLRKYKAAQQVYADLRRPDGTLPIFGDTDGGSDGAGPAVATVDRQRFAGRPVERAWSPSEAFFLAPVAGYSSWWGELGAWPDSSRLSQTAVAWSYFPGMGHKHADEMSLAVWAGGTSWWANVGYWSYDVPGRNEAESWDGANAPHLIGESADSPRQTSLRYHGRNGDLTVIDLERRGPGPYRVRRQVVCVGPRLWVVVDTSSGVDGGRTRTIWTTSPGIRLTEAGGGYDLANASSGKSLRAFFDGASSTVRRTVEGSRSPFGGWSVVGGEVRTAPTVVVERPADGSWALAAWSLGDESKSEPTLTAAPRMQRWAGAEDWEVVLPTPGGPVTLQRHQMRVEVSAALANRIWSLELEPGPDISQARADLHAAFSEAKGKYGTADMSWVYRVKVTAVLLVVLLLNTIVLRVMRRYRPAWVALAGLMLAASWLGLSYYFVFLRAQLV